MERDYETQGAVLIKTKFGLVSATQANFSLSWQEMVGNEAWEKAIDAKTGVHCLIPSELNIPF